MARHRVGPATVQRAIGELAARGLVDARPGRGTFVAPRAAPRAPDTSWQAVPLGARSIDADALETLQHVPPPGTLVLSSGYLPADLQPTAALGAALARAGAAARRVGPRAAGGARRASLVLRGRGRCDGRRRADLPRRPVRPRRLPARARRSGRTGDRRVAHVRRRARRGPRSGPSAGAGTRRRARHSPRSPGRRAAGVRRAGGLPAAAVCEPARRDARPRPPRRRARRRPCGRRVHRRRRRVPRHGVRPGAAAAVHGRPGRPRRARTLAHQAVVTRAADRRRNRPRPRRRAAARRPDRRGPVRRRSAPGGGARARRHAGLARPPAPAATRAPRAPRRAGRALHGRGCCPRAA